MTISLFSIFAVIVIYFYILGRVSQNSLPRQLEANKLAQCPDKPNCVCSEYEQDIEHYIAPLEKIGFSTAEDIAAIKRIIVQMGGDIFHEQGDYLSATFKSGTFGFVDDFEIRVDEKTHQVHLRSASRVGRSDFGVNQKRVEDFKRRLKHTINNRG